MAEKIDKQLVRQVARLARLELTDEETVMFAGQLAAILDYIAKLSELDTKDVEPLAHCLPIHNVFRPDEPRPGLSVEQALANAPDRQDDYFKVPRILDDASGA